MSRRTPPRLMTTALRLANRGWFVFPLRPGDKRPLQGFTHWEEKATRDHRLIYSWWTDAPYNIGIATGPSRLLVIDCDTSNGHEPPPQWRRARGGHDVLEQLAQAEGNTVPRTLRVRTPSGGLHLYFVAPDEPVLGNTAGKLGWRIDTRGVGGYVVSAGSVRPQGYYAVVLQAPVAPLPSWLVDALAPRTHRQVCPPNAPGQDASRYLQAILDGETYRVTSARPGNRNNSLNTAAFILGRLVGGGELAEEDAWLQLTRAAGRHVGTKGFTYEEACRTIASGLRAGMRYPRRIRD